MRCALSSVAAVAGLLLVPSAGAACIADGPPHGATGAGAWRARFVAPTGVLSRPGHGARVVVTPVPGSALSMSWAAVVASRAVGRRCYVAVQRPNGRRGWVSADAVQLAWTRWRIEIKRSLRRAMVIQAGEIVVSTSCTTAEIETFISDVSTTSTNIAIASRIASV